MSSSNLSRNKLTVPVGLSTPKNNRLRSELRRVMSDRVLKITRCSQQQNVEKIKQRLDSSITGPSTPTMSSSQSSLIDPKSIKANMDLEKLKQNKSPLISPSALIKAASIVTPPNQTNDVLKTPLSKDFSPNDLSTITACSKISPTSESNAKLSNKISLLPIKTFNLKDKDSLIKHVRSAYDDVLESNGSIILAVQSITNYVAHYTNANNLDNKTCLVDILKENLFLSNIDLKQKYKNDEQSEKFKLEGQIQILLQIENYIVSNNNVSSNKVKVDEDWVWEIANSIRWLKQAFKDFKIEKFLFGEIYANYFQTAPDFILSLMEELGYDKDDNANESDNNSPNSSPLKKFSQLNDSNNEQKQSNAALKDIIPLSSSSKFLSQLSHSSSNPALNFLREDSNSNYSFTGGVNSLFEDEYPERSNNNDSDLNEHDEQSQNTNLGDSDKLLPDLKKKKQSARFSDFSQSNVRSIVVQRKRMRLKIRSPYKSPSKNFQNKRLVPMTNENSRRSPRIRDKTIFSVESSTSQKRPRTYLITDTPDHKQNATIITTRQEKLRKRFSFQQFNSPNTSLPIVPDTPVKSDSRNNSEQTQEVQTTNPIIYQNMSIQKLYSSPKKNVLFR